VWERSPKRATVVIPIKEGAIDETHIAGELRRRLRRARTGRHDAAEITIFKSRDGGGRRPGRAPGVRTRLERGFGRGFVL